MVGNMTNNDTIMLRHYVPQDHSILEAFQLSESDLKFVKTPEENITAAMSDNERYPIVVMDGMQCVAFFTLHRGKGVAPFSDNQNAVFFRSFSVDQRYRNKGIGKVVMEKLVPFITSTFQDINEIVLTVNTDNPHAMALYRQQGYQYMGDSMFVGRPVHIMALTIK